MKDRHVIAGAVVPFRPEIQFRFHVGVVTAGDVIRHEIDEGFHVVFVNSLEKQFEFIETFLRFRRVIGADVEVIFDRVRTAGDAFEKIGIVGWLADLGVVGSGCLLQNSGEPEVSEAGITQRLQGSVVEINESSDAIFRQRAVLLACFVCVAKEANEQLVDAEFRSAETWSCGRNLVLSGSEIHLKILRDVFVTCARLDTTIIAAEEFSPAIVLRKILCVNCAINCLRVSQLWAWDSKYYGVIVDLSFTCCRSCGIAPFPALPFAFRA